MRNLIWVRGQRVEKGGHRTEETFEGPFSSISVAESHMSVVRAQPYISAVRLYFETLTEATERLNKNQHYGKTEREKDLRMFQYLAVEMDDKEWEPTAFILAVAEDWSIMKINNGDARTPVFVNDILKDRRALEIEMAKVSMLACGVESTAHDGSTYPKRREAAKKIMDVWKTPPN